MTTDELATIAQARGIEPAGEVRSASEIAQGAAQGAADRRARLHAMVTAHHATVWRFLRRLGLDEADASDAAQDVLLVAIDKLDRIEPRAERAYLMRTAYRVGCRLRAKRPRSELDGLADPRPKPDALVDQKKARDLLDRILDTMKDELRAVFVLHDIERLTMAEIADALELKPGTVASRLRRARQDFERHVARLEMQESKR
jgi:RNA polymerase sigma-70 factor, ECF subfamily